MGRWSLSGSKVIVVEVPVAMNQPHASLLLVPLQLAGVVNDVNEPGLLKLPNTHELFTGYLLPALYPQASVAVCAWPIMVANKPMTKSTRYSGTSFKKVLRSSLIGIRDFGEGYHLTCILLVSIRGKWSVEDVLSVQP